MKRDALQNSKRVFAAIVLAAGLMSTIPIQKAAATNDVSASCQIGFSSSCPAQSPQEIYNLYGTTTNGTYWINVNGTATQTYLIMDTSYPDSGMWFLGMKGNKTSTTFTYSSTYWTDANTTLATSSLSDDVSTDAKFNAFNYLPVTRILAVFKDRSTQAFNASGSGDYGTNNFAGHTWTESVASQTMLNRFNTNLNISAASGTYTSYSKYRETNSSSGKLVFPYQTGYFQYGYANTNGQSYRWGVTFNNETSQGSNDSVSGIGLASYSAAGVLSYSDSLSYAVNGGTGALNGGTQTLQSGFQIWGKMAAPSMAVPPSLSRSLVGNGSVQLNIGSASGAIEYALQYKLSADTWANSTTVRLTNPSASPTAVLSGLATGTYDFRVWTRGTNDSSSTSVSLLSQTIDSTAPYVSSDTFGSSASVGNIFSLGETVTVKLNFSETVTVSTAGGTPRIPITGMSGKYFTYTSGSGTTVLIFSYVVAVGDLNNVGLGIGADSLSLNGGSIKDLALNDSLTTNPALIPLISQQVDGIVPTVSSIATSTDGLKVIISLSETQSSYALTGTPFNVSVNGTRSAVTTATQSGTKVTLTLTFGVIAGDTVQITYTDPTPNNDSYALQDIAGNDIATFTMSVTNLSTATSNTSISLRVTPDTTTAIYRFNNSIIATVSTAGKVDFKLQGKYLAGCRNVATTGSAPITATCIWKPSIHNSVIITATLKPSGAGFINSNAAPLQVFVLKRSNTR